MNCIMDWAETKGCNLSVWLCLLPCEAMSMTFPSIYICAYMLSYVLHIIAEPCNHCPPHTRSKIWWFSCGVTPSKAAICQLLVAQTAGVLLRGWTGTSYSKANPDNRIASRISQVRTYSTSGVLSVYSHSKFYFQKKFIKVMEKVNINMHIYYI